VRQFTSSLGAKSFDTPTTASTAANTTSTNMNGRRGLLPLVLLSASAGVPV
jgi:hypothetical protein